MHRQIASLSMATALLAAACSGAAIKNTDQKVPFSARSYPADAPASCPVDDAGVANLGFRRIVAIDEHTVRFELCAPDPAFLEKISLAPFVINDSGHLLTATADGSMNRNPIGTGPFYLESWADGSQIVLNRFNGYWGETAKSERLVFNWQQESAGRLVGLKAGTSDVISNIAPDDLAAAKDDPGIAVYPRIPVNTAWVEMNNTFKPFDDVRVRRAVGLAIDAQRITDNFYPEGSVPATHTVPCVIRLGCVGAPWPARNVDEAKRLLAEAGFPNGFETTLTLSDSVTGFTPQPIETATDIQAQLAEIGITAKIVTLDRTTFKSERKAGKLSGILYGGFNADYLEPSDFLKWLFVDVPRRFGTVDTSISAPINAAVLTADPARREAYYAQANDAIRNLVPLVPLVQASAIAAARSDITGFVASPLEYELAAPVSAPGRSTLVWTVADEPLGLWCADNGTLETAKVCIQVFEGLYGLKGGNAEAAPLLATKCEPSADGLTWTCALRTGVRFHNGESFDAGDVLDSFVAQWDCASPLHKGALSTFNYWHLLSPFLNEESCSKPG